MLKRSMLRRSKIKRNKIRRIRVEKSVTMRSGMAQMWVRRSGMRMRMRM